MYIKIVNGVPENYSITKLREDNPQTSFPRQISEDLLAEFGVYKVKNVAPPTHNKNTQTVVTDGVAVVDGKWTQQWRVVDLPLSQQKENLRVAREKAYKEEADPLFFKAHRNEASMTTWLEAVDRIKKRFPYPEG